jgi:autotransporter-associated beta strand protein
VLAGTAGLTKSGSAIADLGGTNTYSGSTTVNGGTLSVSSAGGLGNAAGAVTVNPGATLYTAGGLTISRTGDVTVNGGNLTSDNNNLGTMSVSGGNIIANNAAVLAVRLAGTAGLTVGGTGETYLWTDSSYTGATVISSGQLTLGGVGAISNQSRLQIASGAAVNLTGFFAPDTINRTFAGLTGAGVLYGGGGTVTVNKTSGTDTFSGDIQGAQGFIKAGSGILILAGSSSYSGATAVNQGGLLVNGTNGGVGAVTVASGAWIGGDGSLAGGLALAVQAKFIFNSAATLDVAGAVSLDNSFSVDSLVQSDGSAIDWGSIADGTYTLINTTSTFNNISNFGAANAADIGGGRTAYFQNGNLQLVVVPEPGAFGLASLGIAAAAWAFRRRK